MTVLGGVAAGRVEFELAFNIAQHGAGAETKEMRLEPGIAEFFLHEREPFDRLLRSLDAAGRFKTDSDAGFLGIFSNHAGHDETDGKRCVNSFFSSGSLDEVRTSHHRNETCLRDIAQREQIAGAENNLEMRRTARVLEGDDFVIEFLPMRPEDVRARDDDVNFLRACRDGTANFGDAIFEGRQACGKTCRDRGDVDFCAFERATGSFNEEMIDADSSNLNIQIGNAELLHDVMLNRLPRLGAEAANALVGIVAA